MKILILRFSSIGDIVLTTPVVRCLKTQAEQTEIHYLTREQYQPLLAANPYIDKIITFRESVTEVAGMLKQQGYDHIIDLHKNLRTKHLLLLLGRRAHSFNKLNKKKLLMVWFRINLLPEVSIVDRYLKAAEFLGISADQQGLDHFIPGTDEVAISGLPDFLQGGYIAVVAGAKQFTKQIPAEKIISICRQLNKHVVLLGGKEDREKGEFIASSLPVEKVFNACGAYSINQSASLIRQSELVITADTGMMHIAAALKKKVVSIWGNTIPAFGMFPYYPEGMQALSRIMEVGGLKCRPCTKLGYSKCPRGHFRCMNDMDESAVIRAVRDLL
jgi:ADP-heptose:LPS heptosyltransferase